MRCLSSSDSLCYCWCGLFCCAGFTSSPAKKRHLSGYRIWNKLNKHLKKPVNEHAAQIQLLISRETGQVPQFPRGNSTCTVSAFVRHNTEMSWWILEIGGE